MNRKHIAAWTLYDLAGSIYSAVIVAAVFNVYFVEVIVGNTDGRGDQVWGWVGSLSVAIVAFSSPMLGSIADRAGVRKRLMIVYTLLGVGAVASFTMLKPGMVWAGFALAVLANLGFEGGLVFYNAYLPNIAPKSHQGRVSGWGFGLGYAGSAVGLLAAYPLAKAQRLDLLWLFVAIWWLVFSVPAFVVLPEARGSGDSVPLFDILPIAENDVVHTSGHINPVSLYYLYFFAKLAGFSEIRFHIDRVKKSAVVLSPLFFVASKLVSYVMNVRRRRQPYWNENKSAVAAMNRWSTFVGRTIIIEAIRGHRGVEAIGSSLDVTGL